MKEPKNCTITLFLQYANNILVTFSTIKNAPNEIVFGLDETNMCPFEEFADRHKEIPLKEGERLVFYIRANAKLKAQAIELDLWKYRKLPVDPATITTEETLPIDITADINSAMTE